MKELMINNKIVGKYTKYATVYHGKNKYHAFHMELGVMEIPDCVVNTRCMHFDTDEPTVLLVDWD